MGSRMRTGFFFVATTALLFQIIIQSRFLLPSNYSSAVSLGAKCAVPPRYTPANSSLLHRHQLLLQNNTDALPRLYTTAEHAREHFAIAISYNPPWGEDIVHLCLKNLRDPSIGNYRGSLFLLTHNPADSFIKSLASVYGVNVIEAPAFDSPPHAMQGKGHFSIKYLKTQLFHIIPRFVGPRGQRIDLVAHIDADVVIMKPISPLFEWISCTFKLGTSGAMSLEYAPHLIRSSERFHGGFFIFHRRQSKLLQEAWATGFRKGHPSGRDQILLGEAVSNMKAAGVPVRIARIPLRFLSHVWRVVPEYDDGAIAPEDTMFLHFSCFSACNGATITPTYNSRPCLDDACKDTALSNCCSYIGRTFDSSARLKNFSNDGMSTAAAVQLPKWKPWRSGSYANTYVLLHNNDEVYGILEKLFSPRNAKRVFKDSEASLIWVTYQRCGEHLKGYNTAHYWSTIQDHAIIATIPGTCEDHYSKDFFCQNSRDNGPYETLTKSTGAIIPCWILPRHRSELESNLQSLSVDWYIVKKKTSASASGTFILQGADLAKELSSGSRSDDMVVQRYYSDPYIIQGRKSDLRVYVLIRTDPLRLYIHTDGWVWVAQQPFTMNDTNKYIHFTNAGGTAPGESEYLRRGRRMAILDFVEKHEKDRWPTFWTLLKRNVASAILTYAHHEDCSTGIYQKKGTRCGRFMNLYAVDCIHNQELTRLKVMEINNNPGMHAYNTLNVSQPNDAAKHIMYHNVYGDMLELLGFNKKLGTFTPRELWEEWDHKLGFDLAFPPEDGDYDKGGFGWYKGLSELSEEDKGQYSELYDHIAEVTRLNSL